MQRFSSFIHFLLTGQPFSPREISEVQGEISFADAIDSHVEWKGRLRESLKDPVIHSHVAREVSDDGACALGRWLMGNGYRRYGHLTSFEEIRTHHSNFHHIARKVVEFHRSDQRALAEEVFARELEKASRAVVAKLRCFSGVFEDRV